VSTILNSAPAAVPRRAVEWPAPPFFTLSGAPPPSGRTECTVNFMDGRVMSGELVEFNRGAESIVLRLTPADDADRIEMDKIRFIKLTLPVTYLANVAALQAIGVKALRAANEKPFTVTFRDVGKISGDTLGFVKEEAGLFLFLVDTQSPLVVKCFIPAVQIKDLQIGPLIGQTLVENVAVSADTLALALTQQAKLRKEQIGKYFADRAIISVTDLQKALEKQGKQPNARLGDILIAGGLITNEELREALEFQQKHRERRIGDILIEMGAVSPRLVQFALSDKLGIPYVNVRDFEIGPGALQAVDMEFAIRRQVLPLLRIGESLVVAVENPLAADFLQDLRFQTGLVIDPVIADPRELKARIAKEYLSLVVRLSDGRRGAGMPGAADAVRSARSAPLVPIKVSDLASQLIRETQSDTRPIKDVEVDTRVSDNTLVRLINKIIIEAHTQGASDIHIECNSGDTDTRIRFRKDGDLEDYLELPQTYSKSLVSRIKIMADLDISEHRHPQDGKIDFSRHGPLAIELRVAIIPTSANLEDVVLRILGGAAPMQLGELGFSAPDFAKLKNMISRSFGLMLVCGPTGSGKTTTLHSVLHEINRPDVKIWTVEDPIEISQAGLRQVQVHTEIGWTFAAAMRAFLRADPDIIMVGEMRDPETTKIAIEASLTGHLVFSTLHTNSAAESIVRLLELGVDPFNFADSLLGILSQRLAKRLCPICKQGHVASDEEIADLIKEYCSDTRLDPVAELARWRVEFGKQGEFMLYRAMGCDACTQGYKGRGIVYELLSGTPKIKQMVHSHATVPELFDVAQQEGMLTIRQNAIELRLQGVLDLPTARAVAS
jgi:type II secretory ATPase GspE/PulE/Tfp pilus assembly ATPase PilB-like protein